MFDLYTIHSRLTLFLVGGARGASEQTAGNQARCRKRLKIINKYRDTDNLVILFKQGSMKYGNLNRFGLQSGPLPTFVILWFLIFLFITQIINSVLE
jgi:hypothetical protein